jgi:hypothetical protein
MALGATPKTMQDLLAEMEQGDLQLPEFQRKFVWKRSGKTELFESLFLGHPIGSIMELEIDPADVMFAWTCFNSVIPPTLRSYEEYEDQKNKGSLLTVTPPKKILLDGQQRMTTIAHLILDTTDRTWYLRCDDLKQNWEGTGCPTPGTTNYDDWLDTLTPAISDIIVDGKTPTNPMNEYHNKRMRLPLSIFSSRTDYNKAIKDYTDTTYQSILKLENNIKNHKLYKGKKTKKELENERDEYKTKIEFLTVINALADVLFGTIIPVVTVPKSMSVVAVCKIFTTINQTGEKLGAFDLVVATVYSDGVRLKQDFDDAMTTRPLSKIIDGEDRTWILQTLAIVGGNKPTTSSLPKTITAQMITKNLQSVFTSFEETCEFLVKHLDVPIKQKGKSSVTFDRILPSIASVQHSTNLNVKGPKLQQSIIKKIKSWYYSSAITKRYSTHSDTRQLGDKDDVINWINGEFNKDMPAWVKTPELTQNIHGSGSGSEGSLMLTMLNEINPSDIHTGKPCSFSAPGQTDVHHIFPKAAMRKKIMTARGITDKKKADNILTSEEFYINSMVNKMLLTAETNRDYIKDKLPSEYIKDLLLIHSEKILKTYFMTHLIDDDCYEALKTDNYVKFIECRTKLMQERISDRIGVPYW